MQIGLPSCLCGLDSDNFLSVEVTLGNVTHIKRKLIQPQQLEIMKTLAMTRKPSLEAIRSLKRELTASIASEI